MYPVAPVKNTFMVSSRPSRAGPSCRGGPSSLDLPLDLREPHAAAEIELDSFLLEQLPLRQLRPGRRPETHPARRVDDPVPWERGRRGEGVQCVPHLTRVAREAGELGHLTVGGDASPRNAPHDGVDPGVAVRAGGLQPHTRNVTGSRQSKGDMHPGMSPSSCSGSLVSMDPGYADTASPSRTTRVSSSTPTAPRSGAIAAPFRSTHAWVNSAPNSTIIAE